MAEIHYLNYQLVKFTFWSLLMPVTTPPQSCQEWNILFQNGGKWPPNNSIGEKMNKNESERENATNGQRIMGKQSQKQQISEGEFKFTA